MGPSEIVDEIKGLFEGRKPNATVVDDAVDLVPKGQDEQIRKLLLAGQCPQPLCDGKLEKVEDHGWPFLLYQCSKCKYQIPSVVDLEKYNEKEKPTPPPIVLIKEGTTEEVPFVKGEDPVPRCTNMCIRNLRDPLNGGSESKFETPCGVDCPEYHPFTEVDDSPAPPEGYGELKVGMEGKLNGVPVKIRKITKKDIILRPMNRSIRDGHGLMVSFEEGK